jgi:hypothetical protein
MSIEWQHVRTVLTVLIGAFSLVMGIIRSDPALMTVGGGLIGFSPAAKGP